MDTETLPSGAAAASRWNAAVHPGPQTTTPIVFAHGFGCDQTIWQTVAPAFIGRTRVALFDHAGCGRADRSLYDRHRHRQLEGYAEDVITVLDALALGPVHFVGHSVSAMIGALAAIRRPDLFRQLIMIGPSACYLNKDGYAGGHDRSAVEELLAFLEVNFVGWANSFAPLATGQPIEDHVTRGFSRILSSNDPEIASAFARTTLLSDYRERLPEVTVPVHVIQTREDMIASDVAVAFLHRTLPHSTLHRMQALGHCPQLTDPSETIEVLNQIFGPTIAAPAPQISATEM